MKIKDILLTCDFLGKTQSFTITKNNTFRTYVGSILSLSIISLMTSFIFFLDFK